MGAITQANRYNNVVSEMTAVHRAYGAEKSQQLSLAGKGWKGGGHGGRVS